MESELMGRIPVTDCIECEPALIDFLEINYFL